MPEADVEAAFPKVCVARDGNTKPPGVSQAFMKRKLHAQANDCNL